MSEPLWPEQRVNEVDHQPYGHEGGERIVEDHWRPPLKSITGIGVADRQHEEGKAESQQYDVEHGRSLSLNIFGATFHLGLE